MVEYKVPQEGESVESGAMATLFLGFASLNKMSYMHPEIIICHIKRPQTRVRAGEFKQRTVCGTTQTTLAPTLATGDNDIRSVVQPMVVRSFDRKSSG